jgi:hypothetical protein
MPKMERKSVGDTREKNMALAMQRFICIVLQQQHEGSMELLASTGST